MNNSAQISNSEDSTSDSSSSSDSSSDTPPSFGNEDEDRLDVELRTLPTSEKSTGLVDKTGQTAGVSTNIAEQCSSFDLRNLVSFNDYQVSTSLLHSKNPKMSPCCVQPQNADRYISVDEDFLRNKAGQSCTQLVSTLFSLPTESKPELGLLATLPAQSEKSFLALPREMPLPKPKPPSKWEQFAKERGITSSKNTKSRKVFDENIGDWKYITGYQRATKAKGLEEWPIMEVKNNDDPYADPWEQVRSKKKERIEKNTINQMRNEERAGMLPRGTANRTMKDTQKKHKYLPQQQERSIKIPSGVPVDLKPNKISNDMMSTSAQQSSSRKRGKDMIHSALEATQRSTASLGKFDPMINGEPERKKLTKTKKKQIDLKRSNVDEKERGMKVLQKVMSGQGSKQKDRDIRKGKYAAGETAYDYDYDDGLNPSSFKKKKGRGGAGKMKKMTKKRIK